ncbi:hypothetical protein [Lysinibacillus fusiformis]|uniref:hypothetical protein n=1 Tax=Lysinibacillus fusiformis TaxID=28031 RepID=UPI00263A8F18|nr:hypothetical protein [Lysinibacillus fusiformis]MDC6267375.1 hypothetical protein [Lysinibacillus sphaericus]MDN4968191.1 hypothetical protein [Lysinibacillus fusiformis]MDN4968365.1 hypothetical protein [Lysinibacillus fusiformis]
MKLVITDELKNNIYTVNVDIKDVTNEDTELFSDYGGQRIDISALVKKTVTEEVDNGDGTTTPTSKEVTLVNEGASYKYMLTDFPITKSFSVVQYGDDAEFIAKEYGKLIETRAKAIIDNLKSKPDNFSGVREVIL